MAVAAHLEPLAQPDGDMEMLWRHFRRDGTHGELFATLEALIQAARDFFERHNRCPRQVLSIIGSHAA